MKKWLSEILKRGFTQISKRQVDYAGTQASDDLKPLAKKGLVVILSEISGALFFTNYDDARIAADKVTGTAADKGVVYQGTMDKNTLEQRDMDILITSPNDIEPVEKGTVALFYTYIPQPPETIRKMFPDQPIYENKEGPEAEKLKEALRELFSHGHGR